MKVIRIGRDTGNDVVINDPLVSRIHCQIIQDDYGHFRLIDMNSSNGTFINGILRHGEVNLKISDIVIIGNTTLPWQTYFENGSISGGATISGSVSSMPSAGYNYSHSPEKPSNFLAWSILATIFCCLPFGIPAIVNSAKVDRLWSEGDYQGSKDAARRARSWFWWSFALGIIFDLIYLIYYIIVGVAIGLGAW